jgi:tetratricopeptide (TPR) repeat protein
MVKYIVLLVSVLSFSIVNADDSSCTSLFSKANNEYVAGNYDQAISLYNKIYSDYGANANLFYNMGNAYYKKGDVGRSMLFLERASWLDPSSADIKKNLDVLRTNCVLMPAELSLVDYYLEYLKVNQWGYVLSGLILIYSILVFIRGVKVDFLSRGAFYKMTFLFMLGCGACLYIIFNQRSDFDKVVVLNKDISVKRSPYELVEQVATCKAGRILYIIREHGDYFYISNHLGVTGWVKKSDVERLLPLTQ